MKNKHISLKEYAQMAKVSIPTLWNWHKKGRISITVLNTPRWVIDTVKFPPEEIKPLKRGVKTKQSNKNINIS